MKNIRMIDKLFDILGGSSILSSIILVIYRSMKELTDPITIVLNLLLLLAGLYYVIIRCRGRIIENKIRRYRWEQLQKIEEDDDDKPPPNSVIHDDSF